MTLSVATLAGFPAKNTTFQPTSGQNWYAAGTPTDAATYSFTNGLYTQSGTQYVAAIIDREGVVPSRIFGADNATGGSSQGTVLLPTLKTVQQLTVIDNLGNTGYGGFIVTLTPAPGTPNDGITPVLTDAPGYTSASPTSSYPQPTMPFKVSNDALLILASTSTG
jgi:hypothetical protein